MYAESDAVKGIPFGLAILFGCAAIATLGCSGSDAVPVAGTVTYNGQPLPAGRVGFYPDDGRPAFGEIENGRFRLTTRHPHDGALPGAHRVTVQSDELTDPNDEFSDRRPLIPERYFHAETSGLTAEVTRRGPNEFTFDLVD